jgi:ribosomal protein L7/L12
MKILLALLAFALAVVVLRAVGSGGEPLPPASEGGIRELLLRGRKIDAIRMYRELHHVGLKDAKEAVERLASQAPGGV